MIKPFVCFFSVFCFVLCFFPVTILAAEKEIHITIDAGHGGGDSGAEAEYDGTVILEKELNLTVARFLGEYLKQYEGVTISYTREEDTSIDLSQRVSIAKENNADFLISIHHNAKGEIADYDHGCTILTGRGVYRKRICQEEQKLACNILYELSEIGLEDQGILLRQSENNTVYENDALADYYAIIRNGLEQKIPSIIIEHAFVDSEEDYKNFLKNEKLLKAIARADAKGIARYYSLETKEEQVKETPVVNQKEKITLITDGDSGDNEISYKTYYKQQNTTEETTTQSGTADEEQEEPSKTILEKILAKIRSWIVN